MPGFPKCRRLLTTPFGAIVCDTTAVGVQIPVPSPYLNKEGDGTSVASFTVGMPMVQVVWRETDLPATMKSRSSLTTVVATETNASAHPSVDTAATGLPNGAKVGVAVGVPLGAVIVLMSLAFFVFVRRHRHRMAANTENRHELPDAGTPQQEQYQMHQNGELPAFSPLAEMSSRHTNHFTTAELPGNSRNNRNGSPKYRARPFSQLGASWNMVGTRR